MAINYKTADQLPLMDEVTDSTYALVEENGTLKRVSGSNLGGSGIKTAIIKSSNYDDVIAYFAGNSESIPALGTVSLTCTNMTFEEAYQIMASGEPLLAIGMIEGEACPNIPLEIFSLER